MIGYLNTQKMQNMQALYALQLNQVASAPIQNLFMVSFTILVEID